MIFSSTPCVPACRASARYGTARCVCVPPTFREARTHTQATAEVRRESGAQPPQHTTSDTHEPLHRRPQTRPVEDHHRRNHPQERARGPQNLADPPAPPVTPVKGCQAVSEALRAPK